MGLKQFIGPNDVKSMFARTNMSNGSCVAERKLNLFSFASVEHR